MNVYLRIGIFLIANFAALGLGGLYTAEGTTSEWYDSLSKAPWTPPGWVFGFSWTFLMICFSIYMGMLIKKENYKNVLTLYIMQWILNFVWNPIFFKYHFALLGLFLISCLTIIVYGFLFKYRKTLGWYNLLILPYIVWMTIATSLNGYIVFMN